MSVRLMAAQAQGSDSIAPVLGARGLPAGRVLNVRSAVYDQVCRTGRDQVCRTGRGQVCPPPPNVEVALETSDAQSDAFSAGSRQRR